LRERRNLSKANAMSRAQPRRFRLGGRTLLVGGLLLLDVWLVRAAVRGPDRPPGAALASAAAFDVLARDGLAAALDSLQRATQQDSLILREGHQIAHALGRQAVAARGGDASVIAQCSPRFASGCYHGVVEGFLRSQGQVNITELERMCVSAGSEDRPGPIHECVHGLGHGVLGALGQDAEAALRHCDELTGRGFTRACHEGVFMEAINTGLNHGTADVGHEGHGGSSSGRLTLDAADHFRPCSTVSEFYAPACWLFQGFVILKAHDFDARAALRMCDEAPGGYAGACYESIGHQLTGLFQRGDRWVIEQCGLGQPSLAPRCAGGAALALSGLDWSGERAVRFCSGVTSDWKDTCYGAAAGLLAYLLRPADLTAVCARIEPAYVDRCRAASVLARDRSG
jgi:hypothetical protein